MESDNTSLISFEEVFAGAKLNEDIKERVKNETHTRLYLAAMNILKEIERNIEGDNSEAMYYVNRFIEFLKEYPVDLMVGIMKDMKSSYPNSYQNALENEDFVEGYFNAYSSIRG